MPEETVPPQELDKVDAEVAQEPEVAVDTQPEPTQVPLHALQKERQKRQELEMEIRWMKEQQLKKAEPVEDPDDGRLESVTREDLGKTKREIVRDIEERVWIKNHPERYEKINELLPEFLKRRPNLASAIEGATNRYEEAWELMDKLTVKEQQKLKAAPIKKDTPGSPTSVPKGAALNQAVDVMSMSDAEYTTWRQAQKRRR